MARIALPPHVHMTVSRGREYTAYHPFRGTKNAGPRIALPGMPYTINRTPNAAWWQAYYAASGTAPPKPVAGSFAAVIAAYRDPDPVTGLASPEWRALSANSRDYYQRHLRTIAAAWGPLPVAALTAADVLALRDAGQDRPAATNQLLAVLSTLLSWSVPRGYRTDNPCDHVKALPRGEPHAAWPDTAIEAFRCDAVPEMWWAVAQALYTGQRRVDVLPMSWRDVDAGEIAVRQEKTGKRVWLPVHRDLAAVLAEIPRVSTRILVSGDGTPWTDEGFKSAWQRQMECLALTGGTFEGLVFHGLRKSAVIKLLEAGCSTAETAAVSGQSLKMVEHYAIGINQRRLARSAIGKWENDRGTGGA